MSNKLRQKILNELKIILNEEEYSGVGFQKDRIAAGVKADPSIQRLVGGNGTPQDILAFVKSQADSYYINDDEAKLMKDSVVSATAKCSKQQLSQEELAWCQEYKTLAPQILKTINFKWTTYTGTQNAMRVEFNKAIGQAEKLSLSAGQASATPAGQTSATPAGQLPTACPNNAQPIESNPDGTQKCPDGTNIAAPKEQATQQASQFGNVRGNIVCADKEAIPLYQQWLKYVGGARLNVDGVYGPQTHRVAQQVLSKKGPGGKAGDPNASKTAFDQAKANNLVCNYVAGVKEVMKTDITNSPAWKASKRTPDMLGKPEKQLAATAYQAPAAPAPAAAAPAAPAPAAAPAKRDSLREQVIKELTHLAKVSKRAGLDKKDKPFYLNVLRTLKEANDIIPSSAQAGEIIPAPRRDLVRGGGRRNKPQTFDSETLQVFQEPDMKKQLDAQRRAERRAAKKQAELEAARQQGRDEQELIMLRQQVKDLKQEAGKQQELTRDVAKSKGVDLTLNQTQQAANVAAGGAGGAGGTATSDATGGSVSGSGNADVRQSNRQTQRGDSVRRGKGRGGDDQGDKDPVEPPKPKTKKCPGHKGKFPAEEPCPPPPDVTPGPTVMCPDGTPAPGGDIAKCSGKTPEPGPTPKPMSKGAKYGLAAAALAAIGVGLFNKFKSSTPEIQDAVRKSVKNPCGLGDFIKAQLGSNYIADDESEAMVSIARSYRDKCQRSKNSCWCKKALECFPDYKTQLENNWSSVLDKQKSDKLEIISIFEEFQELPACAPVKSDTTCPDGTPAPEGDVSKCPSEKPIKKEGTCSKCNVRKGCTGPEVKTVQEKLIAMRMMDLMTNSQEISQQTFGEGTVEAVKKFQTAKKLKVDGIVGPQTAAKLGIKCDGSGGGGRGKGGGKPGNCVPSGRSNDVVSAYGEVIKLMPECENYRMATRAYIQKIIDTNGEFIYDYASDPKNPSATFHCIDDIQKLNKAGICRGKTEKDQELEKRAGQKAYLDSLPAETKNNPLGWDLDAMNKRINTPPPGYVAPTVSQDTTKRDISYEDALKALEENKKFDHERYYDLRKEKDAKILFEKLMKKL